MTISVWRYSHLALAVSSFLFITLAAVTGIILAFEPVNEKMQSFRAGDFNKITVAETLPVLKKTFTEITELTVDANQFVTVDGTDSTGKPVQVYVDPATGKTLGKAHKKSEFFQWVTALHRSLFLHEAGRFFVGLTCFFLLLITISGTVLVIKRQRGIKRFFTKIVKENFAQYYHVVLGRLSLIPIFIIALSGTYLSLVKFNVFPEKKITHKIDFDKTGEEPKKNLADITLFANTKLSQVKSIEFPFSDDPEDYYLVKLRDRELAIDQFSGRILSEVQYPMTAIINNLSLDLHTGRSSIVWAIVLAIACINILFFIYSGFTITLKRIKGRTKNKYKADEARFIILTGSENGSTMRFANAVHQQLLESGQTSFITELNQYRSFAKAEHMIVITATYGLGNPPTNSNKFLSLITKYKQANPVRYSVVGFGSHAYPDFCRFAFDVHNALSMQDWATALLDIHTVNDKSPDQFSQWFATWSQKIDLPQMSLPEALRHMPSGLQKMIVTGRTALSHEGGSFIITMRPARRTKFVSGNVLTVYPANDYRERMYSIGKLGKEIQLAVKLHRHGLGSGFLYKLIPGDIIDTRIVANENFLFPKKTNMVIMIANGTGIAPFLGMMYENDKKIESYLYCGFRDYASFSLYEQDVSQNIDNGKLTKAHIAYSREGEMQYVSDLLIRDAAFITGVLHNKGSILICGSLAMEKDVIALLDRACREHNNQPLSFYQADGQIMSDCY